MRTRDNRKHTAISPNTTMATQNFDFRSISGYIVVEDIIMNLKIFFQVQFTLIPIALAVALVYYLTGWGSPIIAGSAFWASGTLVSTLMLAIKIA